MIGVVIVLDRDPGGLGLRGYTQGHILTGASPYRRVLRFPFSVDAGLMCERILC